MLSPTAGQIVLGIYAVLLAAGGIVGFLKAQSRPSLIAGCASALGIVIALGLSVAQISLGFPLALILAMTLSLFFGYRFARKGRKFMPNGLMAVVSLVVVVFLVVLMLGNTPAAA